MRAMRSTNPVMTGKIFEKQAVAGTGTGAMTINGTITRIAIMLALLVAAASYTWSLVTGQNPAAVQTFILIGVIGGLITALVTVFKPQASPISAPIYAILEGLFLGGISALINQKYAGIPFQAVLLTMGTLFTMLFLYRSGRLRATPRFRRGVIMATGAVFFAYMISWILGMFGVSVGFMHSSGPIGILVSLVIIVVAALNLILDFDFIEKGAAMNAPKFMEWYGAFGLMVTLIWLYIEFLRLLSLLAGRN